MWWEWGSIAGDNLMKISGKTVYASIAKGFLAGLKATESKVPDPIVIVNLVRKAIEAKKPKTRYTGGYMAALVLFMRKILPDRTFDKMLMSQLK